MATATLVVMAAGMGSRFGGCKQLEPVGTANEVLLDYSVYDAKRAGFDKVVFIIKKEMEKDFTEVAGNRIAKNIEVAYSFQEVPSHRKKPYGTGDAIMTTESIVDTPFVVINADDFYGRDAFEQAYRGLMNKDEYCMVGYRLKNTLSDNGSVSRGVCSVADGLLTGVVERTKIVPREGGAAFIEDDGETFLPAGTLVSMNLWAFQNSILDELKNRFSAYLSENVPVNPLKCEYFLPLIPNALIRENAGSVRVLETTERWFGVTYHDDLENVQRAIKTKKAAGEYPEKLWAN